MYGMYDRSAQEPTIAAPRAGVANTYRNQEDHRRQTGLCDMPSGQASIFPMIDIDLSGHVTMITGSSRGIGRAVALLLARSGAKIVLNYKSDRAAGERTAAEIVESGSEALLVQCDVADSASIQSMADAGIE